MGSTLHRDDLVAPARGGGRDAAGASRDPYPAVTDKRDVPKFRSGTYAAALVVEDAPAVSRSPPPVGRGEVTQG
jgi:hypothetical protein